MMNSEQPNIVEVDYDPFAQPELQAVSPTTEAQREIWLACQLSSEASLAYNESVSLQIAGSLSIEALQQALNAMCNRHEALRSTISDDGLNQLIASSGQLIANVLDLTNSPVDVNAALSGLRIQAVEEPFELNNGPLFRATLAVVAKDRFELILTGHHIVCDGWSFGVLAPELMKLYETIAAGSSIRLPPAERFSEYALAELSAEHATAAENDSQYWLSLYRGSIPVLQLPTDRPRPAQRTFASRREDMLLEAPLVAAIRQFGARQGASLFATMFSMFGGLMARLSGSEDIVVGVPAAGQATTAKHTLVGHCVNLLPIRIDANHDKNTQSLISEGSHRVLDAYDHQSSTFGGILRKLQLERDPSRLPLVSVLFNIDSAISSGELSVGGLEVTLRSNPRHYENFELFLNASQIDGEILLELQYNTGLFDQITIRRWLDLYRSALDRMVNRNTSYPTLADLFAPTTADLTLLEQFNNTKAEYPRGVRIESLVEQQAATSPESVAVVAGSVRLTYLELDQRANSLAIELQRQGIGSGQLVGLSCGRNELMLIGLLGILKSGAGYVPLDPSFPSERLEYMATDAKLQIVVSDLSLTDAWAFGDCKRVNVDDFSVTTNRPSLFGSAEDIAYVIYTSGSTGRPKGVRVPHRTVVNLLESVRKEPGMDSHHSVLSITTLSFDIAVSEVILPLTVGARIVVASKNETTDGEGLRDLIQTQRVNFIDATPSTWRLLLASGWQGDSGIRAICTGEPLPPDLGRELLGLVGELWNGYGPTETTVWSSFHRVTTIDGPVPIGHPIANTEILILDSKLRLLPIGVVGELYIGGDGVTQGYLNRPDLTADRFLPDPRSATGAMRYKTGDLGRWRTDGTLECLGRSDHQVKVRGYRIELGEIEACLTKHASVATAIVTTREDQPDDVRIVAYVVSKNDSPLHAGELRDFLRRSLPDYMIPQHIVGLSALPLLPNGKIDRAALPPPEVKSSVSQVQRLAPRTETERQVIALMEEVLRLPGLGLNDDFFALGGHSLLATRLVARLNRQFEITLPLSTIFSHPTGFQLAQVISSTARSDQSKSCPIIRRADQSRAPLSAMQQRLWFIEQLNPGRAIFNTPSAHRLHGKLNEAAFDRAFSELIQRQASLRTAIVEIDQMPYQVILPTLAYSLLPVDDLRDQPDPQTEVRSRINELAALPLALDEAPLFRAKLFRTADEEYVFYFAPHHIIWDGWSFDVLYNDLSSLYEAEHRGIAPRLPDLPFDYGDFATWHNDWMTGSTLQEQVDHWVGKLKGASEPLALPGDFQRPAKGTGDGATMAIEFGEDIVERARKLAKTEEATLFMCLLAAYVLTLHKSTSQRELVVGIPVRGRQFEELESLMGMFVNALPLRLSVDPLQTFRQLLRTVRNEVVDAFKYPDVPFEKLVRELRVPHDLTRSPIYQAFFSFQDARERQATWDDLKHEMIHVLQPSLAEDISMWLMEKPSGLVGGLIYNIDILSSESAALLRQRFDHILSAALHSPDLPLSQIALAQQEAEHLSAWTSTQQEYARTETAHRQVEKQTDAAPTRIALEFGDGRLSYQELEQRSNRLAQMLRGRGIGRGQLVGLCIERGIDMVVSQLAVLKSGAAYVPLDPAYPADRLHYMAEDAKLSVLISQSALTGLVSWPREQTILLDLDAASIITQPSDRLPDGPLSATPDDPAYVIYTSGSTGKPKGVVVHHRAVVNFLTSMQREPGIVAEDRLVAVTTLSFDIAVLELLLPLTVGAQVVLASREQALDPQALAELLSRSRATFVQATPGTWRMLLDSGWHGPAGFKALIGGEALSSDLAARLIPAVGELWNMYGPTETTVWSTCWRVTTADSYISIGRPIANTTIWILDEQRQICPIGVPGELWIGGDGVTLGYLNRPELTAERFIPDPFSTIPGARLYCTGDRARWRNDGKLEHLGRNDFQVKVRGFRIELGEIEAALDTHPAIAQSVVLAREDVPGDVRLVAYFVPRGTAPDANALREHLRSVLPAYMLPQHFVSLDQLPLLPNGKINRKALPPPAISKAAVGELVATDIAVSETERLLVEVWSEFLKTTAITPDDNFFDLGGHSLLAMQVILAVESKIGKRLNPQHMIFDTLHQIAAAYDEMAARIEAPRATPLGRIRAALFGKRN